MHIFETFYLLIDKRKQRYSINNMHTSSLKPIETVKAQSQRRDYCRPRAPEGGEGSSHWSCRVGMLKEQQLFLNLTPSQGRERATPSPGKVTPLTVWVLRSARRTSSLNAFILRMLCPHLASTSTSFLSAAPFDNAWTEPADCVERWEVWTIPYIYIQPQRETTFKHCKEWYILQLAFDVTMVTIVTVTKLTPMFYLQYPLTDDTYL